MFHTLYRTTNLINGKFYIGIHSTKNVNDGYLGSGRDLWKDIRKYGAENFAKEILKLCSSRDDLIRKEKEIVTEEFVLRRDTYNSDLGGGGGKVWTSERRKNMSEAKKRFFQNGGVIWSKGKKLGNRLSYADRKRRSLRISGAGNPMFGINVATLLTPEQDKIRCQRIAESNRKPKKKTDKYSKYAKKRMWIVNENGEIRHCLSSKDERLLSGKFQRGIRWRGHRSTQKED